MAIYDIIRKAVNEVDGVNSSMSKEIGALFSSRGDSRISMGDVRGIMRDVNKVVDRYYGLTPTRAIKSKIFIAITRNTDLATETSFRSVYRGIRNRAQSASPARWAAIEDVMRSSSDPFAEMYMSLFGPDAQRRAIARAGFLDPDRRWVSPQGYKLSERIWGAGQSNIKRIDRTIREGVRAGDGPVTIGKRLEQYLDPGNAPVEYRANGQIVRKRAWKNTSSGASAARRLARSEVRHMANASTREAVQSVEWLGAGVQWRLSNAHPKRDVCDTLAARSSDGYPPGVYTPREYPNVQHPNCLCSDLPWLPPRDQVLRNLERRYTGQRASKDLAIPDDFLENPSGFLMDDFYWGDMGGSVYHDPPMLGPSPILGPGGYDEFAAQAGFPPGGFYPDYFINSLNNEARVKLGQDMVTKDLFRRRGYDLDGADSFWSVADDHLDVRLMTEDMLKQFDIYKDTTGKNTFDRVVIYYDEAESSIVAQVHMSDRYDGTVRVNVANKQWQTGDSPITDRRNRWTVSDNYENQGAGALIHEEGHMLHFRNLKNNNALDTKDYNYFTGRDGRNRIAYDSSGFKPPDESYFASRVSQYGVTDPFEFVAEVYSGLINGEKFDDEIVQMYVNFYGPDPLGMGELSEKDIWQYTKSGKKRRKFPWSKKP